MNFIDKIAVAIIIFIITLIGISIFLDFLNL